MEQKAPIEVWHRVVAFLMGYLAAGLVFILVRELLSLGIVMAIYASGTHVPFSATHVRDFSNVIAALVGVFYWVKAYKYCIANWWKEKRQ